MRTIATAALAAATIALTPAASAQSVDTPDGTHPRIPPPGGGVVFNQCWLESRWDAEGAFALMFGNDANTQEPACAARADPASPKPEGALRFDDPVAVLRHVLTNAPTRPVVYPTEGYYYYTFHLGPTLVSGNIRFSDTFDKGTIGVGYFDALDPRRMIAAEFGAPEHHPGVRVELVARDRVRVGIGGGPSRVFQVVRSRDLPPYPGGLWEGEEFVASIIDESGVPLALMYHEPSASFYYLLHPELPSTDRLVPVDTATTRGRLLVAQRSRFVFYEPPARDRLVLVGVRRRSVLENDWFDGPFDQVPPRLDLKDRLEASYPYVKLRGGIDAHGRFNRLDAQRVAISPYRVYDTLGELGVELAALTHEHDTAREAVLLMVREWKRDFVPPTSSGSLASPPALPQRQGWPANHWGFASGMWPDDHGRATSRAWPANHAVSASHER